MRHVLSLASILRFYYNCELGHLRNATFRIPNRAYRIGAGHIPEVDGIEGEFMYLNFSYFCHQLYPSGATKPPKFASISLEKWIVVKSCMYGPMICKPHGRPERVNPTGAEVAGK